MRRKLKVWKKNWFRRKTKQMTELKHVQLLQNFYGNVKGFEKNRKNMLKLKLKIALPKSQKLRHQSCPEKL